jgi:hypothetical protein
MKASVFKAPSNSKLNCKMNQTKMNTTNTTTSIKGGLAALIGIDWASQRHALCLYDCLRQR